jgi:hypothetical protein
MFRIICSSHFPFIRQLSLQMYFTLSFNIYVWQFIFVAAAKYCVDIATHRHGCCVLQRCISHSIGEHQEKLIAEISANGLLLAQDAYG